MFYYTHTYIKPCSLYVYPSEAGTQITVLDPNCLYFTRDSRCQMMKTETTSRPSEGWRSWINHGDQLEKNTFLLYLGFDSVMVLQHADLFNSHSEKCFDG